MTTSLETLPFQWPSLVGEGEEVCSVSRVIHNALQQVLLVSQLVWAVVQLAHLLGRLYPEALWHLNPNLHMPHITHQGQCIFLRSNEHVSYRISARVPTGASLGLYIPDASRGQVIAEIQKLNSARITKLSQTTCTVPADSDADVHKSLNRSLCQSSHAQHLCTAI